MKKLFNERAGMSQEAFGAKFDIGSQGMVWQYLNAKSPLNLVAALKFCNGLRCDIVDFSPRLASELSPSSDTNLSSAHAESNAEEGPKIGRLLRVPVVGMAQLGDNGFWAELETPVGYGDGFIPFPAKSRNAYALRCRGDSMKPRIKNGEFVVVDPEIEPAPGDEVLLKAKDGRVMVKELLYIRDEAVHLLSVNEAHGKMTFPMADIDCLHCIAGIMPAHTWVKE